MISRPKKRTGGGQSEADLFFSIPELAQRLDLLRHLIENSELIPLLRAEAGSGKTTMLFRLLSLAESSWVPCRVDANPMMHPDQLLQRLVACFGLLDVQEPDLERVAQRAQVLRKQGKLPVVMVDDADQLPPETLIALLKLNEYRSDEVPAVSVLLFASPAIDEVLSSPQLQTMNLQVLHPLDVPRLRPAQIPRYVQHLLKVEGIKTGFLVEPAQVDKLFRESEGLPGRINSQILKMLREPAAERPPRSEGITGIFQDVLTPPRVGVLAGVVALVTAVLLFQNTINSFFGGGTGKERAPELAYEDGLGAKIQNGSSEPAGDASVIVPLELPPPAAGDESLVEEDESRTVEKMEGMTADGTMAMNIPEALALPEKATAAQEALPPPPAMEKQGDEMGEKEQAPKPLKASPAEKRASVAAKPDGEARIEKTHEEGGTPSDQPEADETVAAAQATATTKVPEVVTKPASSKPLEQPSPPPVAKEVVPSEAMKITKGTPVEERSTLGAEETAAEDAEVVAETVEAVAPKPVEKVVVEERGRELLAERPLEKTLFEGAERVEAAPPKQTRPRVSESLPKVPAKAAAAAIGGAPKREAWLQQQNPRHYVLQIRAVGSETALKKYIQTHRLEDKAAYFRTMRDGKPWFSLVYGLYPDREAAVAAKARLPAGIRKQGGWPRSIESIQAAIKAAGKS